MNNPYIRNPQLAGEEFFWLGNQTGVVLIHGFTATTAEVRLAAELLHQDEYTTAGPLLPGHGTHPKDLNRTTWQMWLEKVKEIYEKTLHHCENVFVIGESMGALLAIELAAQHPEVAGLMLFSPALKAKNLWLARFLSPFKAYLEKSNKDDGLAWKGYTVYPLKASVELLKLQNHTRKQLNRIEQPTLIVTGDLDKTIATNSAEIILDGIQSKFKQHIQMNESTHCVLLDKELGLAYRYVTAFMSDPTLTGHPNIDC
ncbi:MAG: alpha/beta fold hydrolase [Chloroflexota bacterium]|nr:alpha/beta fold hydrolase [Chloroflexota bacterium]